MTKHQQYFQDMLESHKKLFDEFSHIHNEYVNDAQKWQPTFNEKGQEVLQIIRRYENMLCAKSESGKYSKFSSKLADKFWGMIRAKFSKIDFVGMS